MFRRQIEVIGKENQEILSKKSVLIVGAGGLGNSIATILSCVGLKEIILIDFDKIEIHNLHRQFQFDMNDIGKYKSEILSKKISRCNTEIKYLISHFKSEFDIEVDLVFDATDNFETRKEIDKFSKKYKIPWIYASVDNFLGQVGVFKHSSLDIFASFKSDSKGQLPPMVSLVSSISAMLGLKVLLGEQKEVLYVINFENDLEIKKFYI